MLRSYRQFKREECLDLAAEEGDHATFLEQQLSRVDRWIGILERHPGAEGRFSVHVTLARVGQVIRAGRKRHKIVGLGWADRWDMQGKPSMRKVATVALREMEEELHDLPTNPTAHRGRKAGGV